MSEIVETSDDREATDRLLRSIDTALSGGWRDYLLYNTVLAIVRSLLVTVLWVSVWARGGLVGLVAAAVAVFVYVQLEAYLWVLVRRRAYWSSHGEGSWHS